MKRKSPVETKTASDVKIRCQFKKMVAINDLKEHPKNRNKHPAEQITRLAQIIEYQGFRHPVIVSNLSGFVVAGHGRLAVAKQLGMLEVPVDFQDFADEEAEYAFLVSDNAIALWSELDLSGINADTFDLDPTFNIDLLGLENFTVIETEKTEGLTDPDALPEAVDTRSKPGDVWLLGKHRVMCGSATVIDDVNKLMAGRKANMVFTDPPYNVDYQGGNHAEYDRKGGLKIQNDKMDNDTFYQFLLDAFVSMFTVTEPGGGYLYRSCRQRGYQLPYCHGERRVSVQTMHHLGKAEHRHG